MFEYTVPEWVVKNVEPLSPGQAYLERIFSSIPDETPPQISMSPRVIGFWYSEDTYCWECGKDLPDIDGAGNPRTTIFDTELEELLEGWSRTMSYVGCVACRKGADRWEKIYFPKSPLSDDLQWS